MIELITGHSGSNHISSKDVGLFNSAIIGPGNYLLDTQEKIPATIINSNTIKIGTGDILMQGRHISIQEAENVSLSSGTTGFNRIDLICVKYQATSYGVESVSLSVVEGEPVTGEPAEPSFTQGNIATGSALVCELPIYKVRITGLTPQKPEPLLTSCLATIFYLQQELAKKITAEKIQNGTIGTALLADGSVTSAKIADGGIYEQDIANGAVTVNKIANGHVTNEKIAYGAINSSKIANGAIEGWNIGNGQIYGSKLADYTIEPEKLTWRARNSMCESGNYNGWDYIKYENGIAICSRWLATASVKKKWGYIFSSSEIGSVDYPFAFITEPVVTMTPQQAEGALWVVLTNRGNRVSTPPFFLASGTSQEDKPGNVSVIAMGRWR